MTSNIIPPDLAIDMLLDQLATDQGTVDTTRWQNQYAYPNWQSMLTQLNPQQEAQFQQWATQNNVPITNDYDMRGFWLNGGSGTSVNPNDGRLHYPDTYKTPLHQSFSGESVFANPITQPPTWNDLDQLVTPQGIVVYDERKANNK